MKEERPNLSSLQRIDVVPNVHVDPWAGGGEPAVPFGAAGPWFPAGALPGTYTLRIPTDRPTWRLPAS
jgi:hypothetical protein